MSFTLKQATRQSVKALVGMYGRSSSGKTMSALLYARGIVGDKGRICLVDSEGGRGSIFADLIPGGYNVIEIDAPFSPQRYTEALEEAEKHADIIVVDSLSHEHCSEGGVLDMQEAELTRMAGDDWKKREACKMAAWIKPKYAHKMFIQRLLRCKCALICCLRGEEKTHIEKGQDGKSKVITDQFSTPIFDQRFIYELLLNFELVARNGQGGYAIPRKITHPSIAPLLPGENEQIGIKHGQALAAWCAGTATAKQSTPSPVKPSATPASKEATEATKAWALKELSVYGDVLHSFFEQSGWIMPNEEVTDIPLSKVPTSKQALHELMGKIEAFRESGSV